jgi:hypothetical protein
MAAMRRRTIWLRVKDPITGIYRVFAFGTIFAVWRING